MAINVEQNPFISFVNQHDYSSTSIPRKHPRNERVTSAEELGTMSKNNLRLISIWRIHSLTLSSYCSARALDRASCVSFALSFLDIFAARFHSSRIVLT